ncbi:MAG: flagellar hook-length control protein FliK [Porticoccaceae bacterium]
MPSTDSLLLVPAKQVNHPASSRRVSGSQESPTDRGFGEVLASQSSSRSTAQADNAQGSETAVDAVAQNDGSVETVSSGNGLPQQGNDLPQDADPKAGEESAAELLEQVLAETDGEEQGQSLVDELTLAGEEPESDAGASDEADPELLSGLPGKADPHFNPNAAAALAEHQPDFPTHAAAADKFSQALPPGRQLTATMAAANGATAAEAATSVPPGTSPVGADAVLSAQQDMPVGDLPPLDADALTAAEDIIDFNKETPSVSREQGGQSSATQSLLARAAGQGLVSDLASGTAKPSSGVLHSPMGSASWNTDMAGRLTLMINSQTEQATLKLNPPELGRMDIKISTDGDRTNIHFMVDNGMAKDALEAAMPRLRQLMEMSGLQLAQAQVSQHSGGQSHSQAQSQLSQQGGGQGQNASTAAGIGASVEMELTEDYLPSGVPIGRIDYFI